MCPLLRPRGGGHGRSHCGPATVTSHWQEQGCVSSGLGTGSCRRKEGQERGGHERTTTEDPITGPVQAGLYTGRTTIPMLPAGKWRLREAKEAPTTVWLVQSKGILSTTSPLEKGLEAPDAAIRDVCMRKTLLRQVFWGPSKPSRRF